MRSFFKLSRLVTLLLAASLTACVSTPKKPETSPAKASQKPPPVLLGVYRGILPCPDCQGIETELILLKENQHTAEGNYRLKETYLGSRKAPQENKGSWTTQRGSAEDPDAVVYQLNPDEPKNARLYLKSGPETIQPLDAKGKRILSKWNQTLTRESLQLPNPATTYCASLSGVSEMKKDKEKPPYWYCRLQDGRECEEWALFYEKVCNPP